MKYPIFIELADRRVVIVGAGTVALRKAKKLLEAGARVVIVAEHVDPAIEILAQENKNVELAKAPYSSEYLAEATLCIAATNNRPVNKQIYHDCQKRNILCNVVDDPELCDFFSPAVVQRGDLTIAIGTQGFAPSYAGRIRQKLESIITEHHGRFLTELECMRSKVLKEISDPGVRKTILGKLVDDDSTEFFMTHTPDEWRDYAEDIISKHKISL
jgi:precorrin-2 dehydrogenase / sirohydrochlorin ferrochelatase